MQIQGPRSKPREQIQYTWWRLGWGSQNLQESQLALHRPEGFAGAQVDPGAAALLELRCPASYGSRFQGQARWASLAHRQAAGRAPC